MNEIESERTGDQIACHRCGYPLKWCTCEGGDDEPSGEDAPAQDEEAALECAPAQDEEAALECVPMKVARKERNKAPAPPAPQPALQAAAPPPPRQPSQPQRALSGPPVLPAASPSPQPSPAFAAVRAASVPTLATAGGASELGGEAAAPTPAPVLTEIDEDSVEAMAPAPDVRAVEAAAWRALEALGWREDTRGPNGRAAPRYRRPRSLSARNGGVEEVDFFRSRADAIAYAASHQSQRSTASEDSDEGAPPGSPAPRRASMRGSRRAVGFYRTSRGCDETNGSSSSSSDGSSSSASLSSLSSDDDDEHQPTSDDEPPRRPRRRTTARMTTAKAVLDDREDHLEKTARVIARMRGPPKEPCKTPQNATLDDGLIVGTNTRGTRLSEAARFKRLVKRVPLAPQAPKPQTVKQQLNEATEATFVGPFAHPSNAPDDVRNDKDKKRARTEANDGAPDGGDGSDGVDSDVEDVNWDDWDWRRNGNKQLPNPYEDVGEVSYEPPAWMPDALNHVLRTGAQPPAPPVVPPVAAEPPMSGPPPVPTAAPTAAPTATLTAALTAAPPPAMPAGAPAAAPAAAPTAAQPAAPAAAPAAAPTPSVEKKRRAKNPPPKEEMVFGGSRKAAWPPRQSAGAACRKLLQTLGGATEDEANAWCLRRAHVALSVGLTHQDKNECVGFRGECLEPRAPGIGKRPDFGVGYTYVKGPSQERTVAVAVEIRGLRKRRGAWLCGACADKTVEGDEDAFKFNAIRRKSWCCGPGGPEGDDPKLFCLERHLQHGRGLMAGFVLADVGGSADPAAVEAEFARLNVGPVHERCIFCYKCAVKAAELHGGTVFPMKVPGSGDTADALRIAKESAAKVAEKLG